MSEKRRLSPGRKIAVATLLAAVPSAAIAYSVLPSSAASTPAAATTYTLVVKKSAMCLDVPSASTTSGALLQQNTCATSATKQQFTLVSAGTSVYQLVNKNSGLCVDVPSGSTTSGKQLQQVTCTAKESHDLWRLTASGTGTYQVINANSGLCMSDSGASTTAGTAIVQETCTANSNKQWAFTAVTTTSSTSYTVAADGTGKYTTVQAAIDAVGTGNSSRQTITIKPGTYREIVTVPATKPYITLQGGGSTASEVVIVNNRGAATYGTFATPTMYVYGADFIASNLTVSNDFDETGLTSGTQAVALRVDGDRAEFDNVRLLGDQDTLLVNLGSRAYFESSYIEGTVDFIFGYGTAVFNACSIYEKRSTGGPITAAKTPADQTYGFLIYKSTITGATSNTTQLGRPWGADAQVVFRENTLGATIATSQPWIDMSGNVWEDARFFEYGNTGSGATTNSNRPQLTASQAAAYTPQKYLAGSDSWNPIG
ncbi:pectinesterase family protein [Actinoplanes sp. NPDC051851]|uniref:pectinesterase family protein n=1 Tax=Actinoplanes sp. NPDC051851 TaxID=3154753 RepID=UPI00343B953A